MELLSLLQKQLLEALEIYRPAVVVVLSFLPTRSYWRLQPNLIVMNLCLNASRKARRAMKETQSNMLGMLILHHFGPGPCGQANNLHVSLKLYNDMLSRCIDGPAYHGHLALVDTDDGNSCAFFVNCKQT